MPDHDFTAQRVVWGKRLDGTPLELVENDQQQSQKFNAVKLLEEMLANGPVSVRDLQAAAKAHGISWPTVERATRHIGTIGAKRNGAGWCWCKNVMAFDGPLLMVP